MLSFERVLEENRHEKQSFGAAFCYAEKEKNEYDAT